MDDRDLAMWLAWRQELRQALGKDRLLVFHRRSAPRHFAVAGALYTMIALATLALWQARWPWLWAPAALAMGLAVFDTTVLLHEALHRLVFAAPSPRLYRLLEWCYALPTAIAPSQFSRWHLDHHEHLGSETLDPKRHRLSPKRNARWLKGLYFTPALFAIYFHAARRETRSYPESLRRRVSRERLCGLALHLLAAVGLGWFGGWGVLIRVYVIPFLAVFPAAFALNRMGQHYAITPRDPAGWTTRVKGSWFWDAAFLWSGYHLEHHAFPGVPFYRLPALSRALAPALDRRGIRVRTFPGLLWLYLVHNKAPHSDWD